MEWTASADACVWSLSGGVRGPLRQEQGKQGVQLELMRTERKWGMKATGAVWAKGHDTTWVLTRMSLAAAARAHLRGVRGGAQGQQARPGLTVLLTRDGMDVVTAVLFPVDMRVERSNFLMG